MPRMTISDTRYAFFLQHLREIPNIARAARLAGFSRQHAFDEKKANPEFAKQWEEALAESLERMELIAHQRAFDGIGKPLTYQGQLTYERDFTAKEIDPETGHEVFVAPHLAPYKRDVDGKLIAITIPEVSDSLLMFMLRAHLPDKYRERQDVNLTGTIDIASAILAARKRCCKN
jgi:hypothetical protein